MTLERPFLFYRFKKFHLGCKNLDNQARSGCLKMVDSEVQSHRGKLGEYQKSLASHSPGMFVSFRILAKASGAAKLCFMLPKYCKTFDSHNYAACYQIIAKLLTHSSNTILRECKRQ